MRRILILFVFLAGIGAAAFVYLDSLNASKKQISREPSRVQIENAGTWYISRQIEQQRYKISLSVPGTHPEPKVYSIRGSLMATGERPDTDGIPFYAAIVAICDNWSELDCWKLRSISIAGQDQLVLASLAEPAAGAELTDKKETVLNPADAIPPSHPKTRTAEKIAETTKTEEADKVTVKSPMTMPEQVSAIGAAVIAEKQKWQTINDAVNARAGPGTEHKTYFKMPTRVQLSLIKTEGKWGLFEYTGINRQVGRAWISMPLVKQVSNPN